MLTSEPRVSAEAAGVDLGMSPLWEAFPAADELNRTEPFYPLRMCVCAMCFLVQVEDYVGPAYPYFSSYSSSWFQHAEQYVAASVDERCAHELAAPAGVELAASAGMAPWPSEGPAHGLSEHGPLKEAL